MSAVNPPASPGTPLSPFENTGFFSRFTFGWLSPVVKKGTELQVDTLVLPSTTTSSACTERFSKFWEEEKKKQQPSLFRALRRCFLHEFLIAGFFKLCWAAFVLLAAFYFVRSLLSFVQTKEQSNAGWILSAFFFVCCFLLSVSLQQMSSFSTHMGIKVRAALLTLVFRKSLVLKNANANLGDIVSLAAVDCSKLLDGCTNIHYLWSGPLEAIVICALLLYLIGVSALPGLGALLVIVPLQFWIGKKVTRLRAKIVGITDERVQRMSEILLAAKLVKFYAWEKWFAKSVSEVREKELVLLKQSSLIKSVNLLLVFIIPPIMGLVIFSTYSVLQGHLTPTLAFTTLSLFNTLRFPLVVLPKALKNFAESLAALSRLQDFFLQPDFVPIPRSSTPGVKLTNAEVSYTSGGPVLTDINIHVPQGKLFALVGPVGSGKTTFFNSMLGVASVTKGTMEIGGRLAYVPQLPWIQHGTVRDNILFGKPYDEAKYRKVIFACALERDMTILTNGDLTEIGERGINLSGGQKQRIALARAAYSDADVYLLDNPLSAVDQHTCNHIFSNCIQGILGGKTVLLGTHQIHLLSQCDLVGIMRSGRISYFGPFDVSAVTAIYPEWAPMLHGVSSDHHHAPSTHQHKEPVTSTQSISAEGKKEVEISSKEVAIQVQEVLQTPKSADGHQATTSATPSKVELTPEQIQEQELEKVSQGSLPYKTWIRVAGPLLVTVSVALFAITQTVRIVSDTFISWWTQNLFKHDDELFYIIGYFIFVTVFGLFLLARGLTFYHVSLGAATRLHNNMFKRVLRAPISFYFTTPLGKVLNCFSKDQDQADEALADTTHMTLIYCAILLTTIILTCTQLPYFTIVVVVLFGSFILLTSTYLGSARALKIAVGNTNSRVFAHLSETLSGLSVVRAFEAESRFALNNAQFVDHNHGAQFHLDQVQLWLSFRLDFIGSLLVLATALISIGLRDVYSPSAVGLAISNSFQALVFFAWVVRGFADIDSQIGCISRISYFAERTQVEVDDDATDKLPKPPAQWPQHGKVEFDQTVMKYLPHLKPAINGASFTIQPGEKVGVVGRTGSGKSSLLMALFRLSPACDGQILVDGQDISTFELDELRSRFSIIPQEPVMFKGTIRSNLDPFGLVKEDRQLWRALELTHLKGLVESLPMKLESPVFEGGSNFSLGTKQLFCLARSVLKESKVLALDEATAALDMDTDALVQKTIREVFADRTVITIAHRLDTIAHCDKILAMDEGRVKEFDTPANLLRNPDSFFARLVEDTGSEADNLKTLIYSYEAARCAQK